MMLFALLIGTLLRLVGINQSLWLDEAISALAAKNFTYIGLVTQFAKYDFHPPLFYLILKFWGSVFGYSEAALRILPITFGVLTIMLVVKVARELKLKPFWVAALLATSPLHVYYSQEVRMYPLAAFFVLLSLYSILKIAKKKSSIYYFSLALSVFAFCALDYVAVLVLPAVFITLLLTKKDRVGYIRLALVFLPLVFVAILWLPTLLFQVSGARNLSESLPLWRAIIGSPTLKEMALVWIKFIVGRLSFYNKTLYALFVFAVSIPFGYAFIKGARSTKKNILFWFTTPLILGFVISFFVPAFSYFRFLFLLPIFYLIVVSGIKSKVLFYLLIGIQVICLLLFFLNTNLWREDWKGAVLYVEQNSSLGDISVFEFEEPIAGWQWYSTGKVEAFGLLDKTTDALPDSADNIWYFEYLADITDPARLKLEALENKGYRKVGEQSFRGVGKIIKLTKEQ